MTRPDPATRHVCAWCMRTIPADCTYETVLYAGRQIDYCDSLTDPDRACYTDHLHGVTGPPRRSRDDRARRP